MPSPAVTRARPWRRPEPPRRVLLIRLQALGDLVITIPYAAALRRSLSGTEIDLLAREEVAEIPEQVVLFDHVFRLGGGRATSRQLFHALRLVPTLRERRYDAVLDLQNNHVSGIVRRLLRSEAWCAFDRSSPVSHGDRTRHAIEAAGFPLAKVGPDVMLRDESLGLGLLRQAGWSEEEELVVLNPAGAFPSRQWPIENYASFARAWRKRHPARFLVLGLPSLAERVRPLREALGRELIDLVGRTRPAEAYAIVRRARFILTEDSGLMHMAWTSGVPTLALFGASRSDWSAPQGPLSVCLHSGDLPCGACMEAFCRFGDVHCLTRYTPESVLEHAESLLGRAVLGARPSW